MSEEEKKPEGKGIFKGGFVPPNMFFDESIFNRGSWVLPHFNPFLRNDSPVIPKKEMDSLLAQDDAVLTPITIEFIKGFAPVPFNKAISPGDKYLFTKLREVVDLYTSSIFWNGLLPKVDTATLKATEKPQSVSVYGFFYKTVYARMEPNYVAIVHISEALKLFREIREGSVWIRESKGNWLIVDSQSLIPYVRVQITRFPTNGIWMIDRKGLRNKLEQRLSELRNNPNSSEGENSEG